MEADELNIDQENSSLNSLLGILVPFQLNHYVTMLTGGNKKKLVNIITEHNDKRIKKSKARILQFTASEKKKELKINKGDFEEIEKSQPGDMKGTSLFILEEKKRLKASQFKLKSREVLELYKKSAEVNITEEKSTRDDLSKSSKVGVLVNKRQY